MHLLVGRPFRATSVNKARSVRLSVRLTTRPQEAAHKPWTVTEKDGGSQTAEQLYSHTRAETNLVALSI
jgi:hypothetical protein